MKIKNLKSQEYYELKSQINEIQKMVESIYNLFLNPDKSEKQITFAKVYQLDQKARKKALEIKDKLNLK